MRSWHYIKTIGPGIAWALFIMLGSLLPSNRLPSQEIPDKAIHFFIYFVLGLLLCFGFAKQVRWPRMRINAAWYAFGISLLYGVILELVQLLFIPSRSGEWLDFVANALGAILVVPVFKLIVGNIFDKK